MWGGTHVGDDLVIAVLISIHPPRVGRDLRCRQLRASRRNFNPPSPCGEGLGTKIYDDITDAFQSTLPVWGGTLQRLLRVLAGQISIHPPRVGRDFTALFVEHIREISIHPPRVGRDLNPALSVFVQRISIHPPRVERDRVLCWTSLRPCNFNPPSPCGEGHTRPGTQNHQ